MTDSTAATLNRMTRSAVMVMVPPTFQMSVGSWLSTTITSEP